MAFFFVYCHILSPPPLTKKLILFCFYFRWRACCYQRPAPPNILKGEARSGGLLQGKFGRGVAGMQCPSANPRWQIAENQRDGHCFVRVFLIPIFQTLL